MLRRHPVPLRNVSSLSCPDTITVHTTIFFCPRLLLSIPLFVSLFNLIHSITLFVQNVDNVPLLVPLFSESSPAAIVEMLLIMQENELVWSKAIHAMRKSALLAAIPLTNPDCFLPSHTRLSLSISFEPQTKKYFHRRSVPLAAR